MTPEKPKPVYDCMDCGERIEQDGEPIPGTGGVLGYYRYCEKCRSEGAMTPEQLADEIVALGIGSTSRAGQYTFYHLPPDSGTQAEPAISADLFTSDWRVAGAMMERVRRGVNTDIAIRITEPYSELKYSVIVHAHFGSNDLPRFSATGDNLPRAINEACAAALREGK